MRGESLRLPTPVDGAGAPTTGSGEPVKVADYAELALQYHLTGAANVSVEMSLQKQPLQWVSAGAGFAGLTAGDAVVELPEYTILWLRVVVATAIGASDTLAVACANGRT